MAKTEKRHIFANTTLEQYDFVSKMSGYTGTSLSGYVCGLIDEDMERKKEIYEKLCAFGFQGKKGE